MKTMNRLPVLAWLAIPYPVPTAPNFLKKKTTSCQVSGELLTGSVIGTIPGK